jgi:hypothetical protein
MIDVLHRLVAGDDDREHLDVLHCLAGKVQDEDRMRRNANQKLLKGKGAQTA